MNKTLAFKPRQSEKAYAQSEAENTYVFDIAARTTRLEVMRAVSSQYGVSVKSARIAKIASKSKRRYRNKGRRWQKGQSAAVRKAYVTLKEGDRLPIFASEEEKSERKK